MLKNYFKIAFRNLIRHRVYAAVNIAGLAVGLACAVLIMLWVRYELSYDKFNKNADRLYRVDFTTEQKDYYGSYQPGPLAEYLKDNFPEIEYTSNYADGTYKVSRGTKGFFCTGAIVSEDFFRMFTFPMVQGNERTALSAPNSIVISRSLAAKIFGQTDPVGRSLKLNDRAGFMVTGVFSDVPPTSSMQFDLVLPHSGAPSYMKKWGMKSVETYVLLQKNASSTDVDKKIAGVMNKFNPTWKNVLYLFPAADIHLRNPGGGGPIVYVYFFSAFALLILIVACINFMNLSTARSETRVKEIGIKKTVGSSRLELIRQFMVESILLSLVSLLIATVAIELCLPGLNNMLGTHIAFVLSGRNAAMLLGIALATGLLAGSYPAFYLSSFKPTSALKGRTPVVGALRSSFIRNFLVVVQFSFSIFVITCVLFIGKQLSFIRAQSLGFNKDNVLMISTRGDLRNRVPVVKEELLKYPSVHGVTVSATDFTTFAGAGSGPIDWEGKKSNRVLEVGFNFVDDDFAKTFQVKMVRGRFFSKERPSDSSGAFVVNQAAVKAMGLEDPINRSLTTWFGMKGKIVGVIQDFNTQSLRDEVSPLVLIPTRAANYMCIRLSPTGIPEAIKTIERTVKKIVPDDPFEYRFLDQVLDNQYRTEQRTDKLATLVAALSIFISCLGLLGLAAFSSERRTKEIGIRKVLGASNTGVLGMLTGDFTRWVLVANLVAWPAAWYVMGVWLRNFSYRIELSWWTFGIAGGLTLLIALLAVGWQAIRAAIANPVESLRYE